MEQLASNTQQRRTARLASTHLLTGRIRDGEGHALSPSHARKEPHRYRYYVSQAVLRGDASPAIRRLSAPEVEATVIAALRAAIPKNQQQDDDPAQIEAHLERVVVHPDRLELRLTGDREAITVTFTTEPIRRRRDIILPPGADPNVRRMKPEERVRILRAIATGRAWMDELLSSRMPSTDAIASREILSERSVRMTVSLAHLAPSIVRAIIDGRLPRGIGIKSLADLPPSWAEQERALGL